MNNTVTMINNQIQATTLATNKVLRNTYTLQQKHVMRDASPTTVDMTRRKQRPLVDLLVSIFIPSVILMKFSGTEDPGASGALIVALAFPVSWGLFELFKYRKFNFIALPGLVSVLPMANNP